MDVTGIDLSNFTDGTLTFHVYVTDAAGNDGAEPSPDPTATLATAYTVDLTDAQTVVDYADSAATAGFTIDFPGFQPGMTYSYSVYEGSDPVAGFTGTGPMQSAAQAVTVDLSGTNISDSTDLTYRVIVSSNGQSGPSISSAAVNLDRTRPVRSRSRSIRRQTRV